MMRTFRLDKLVRDQVFDDGQKHGRSIKFTVLGKTEYLKALKNKLLEESDEFDPTDPQAVEELADILEVLEHLSAELDITPDQLQRTQTEKRKRKGAFSKRVFIKTVTLPDDDPWVEYYLADPKRFPEVE